VEKDDTSALSGDGILKPSIGPVNSTNALVKNRPGKLNQQSFHMMLKLANNKISKNQVNSRTKPSLGAKSSFGKYATNITPTASAAALSNTKPAKNSPTRMFFAASEVGTKKGKPPLDLHR